MRAFLPSPPIFKENHMFDTLNIIDYALLAFAALSVLLGVYRGSVCTGLTVMALYCPCSSRALPILMLPSGSPDTMCSWNTSSISPRAPRTSLLP